MKKILNERNEKLFSRLFENQGIKLQINENIADGWKIAADFDVIKIKTPEGYMGQESMDLAFPGAVTAEDVALELAGGDESMAKKIEYNLLRDDAFLAAVKSAQNDLDDYSAGQMKEDETPGLDKALAHTAITKDLKKMNTRPEVAELITKVISAVKDQLPNLSDNILVQAVKDVLSTLKDMGDDASKLVGDIGDDIESTFKEVHAAVNPYNSDVDQTDDKKKI